MGWGGSPPSPAARKEGRRRWCWEGSCMPKLKNHQVRGQGRYAHTPPPPQHHHHHHNKNTRYMKASNQQYIKCNSDLLSHINRTAGISDANTGPIIQFFLPTKFATSSDLMLQYFQTSSRSHSADQSRSMLPKEETLAHPHGVIFVNIKEYSSPLHCHLMARPGGVGCKDAAPLI